MSKWIAYKDGRVKAISSHLFESKELQVLEAPKTLDAFSNEEIMLARVKDNQVVLPHTKKEAKQLKLAIITNIFERCGISTYSEHLIEQLSKYIGEFRIFAENNDTPTDTKRKWPVVECWKRNETPTNLIKQLKEYDPDVIWISHEWGLWPNARHWLTLLTQLSEYRIITTLHSIFPDHLDKTISEAAIPEIIVHSYGAKLALEKKGVKSKISVIPHGSYELSNQSKLWNIYRSEHTIIQQGFGFKYKGMTTSIKAVAILKLKYPDIFLTILFSESPFNKLGHQNYYDELTALIKELNIEDNIAIIRGYQTDEVIDAYYRVNKVAVFPYESEPGHLVFGASGAARLAMAKGIPTISSSIPHFIDTPTIKAETPEQIAAALDILFSDPKKQTEQIEKQNQYARENNWDITAQRYVKVFEGP